MNSESSRPSARAYVSGLAASGRYHFTSREAQAALGVSAAAAKLALNRLAKQKLVASPARGFYVILPPEHGALGCLPADQFIPALMKLQRRQSSDRTDRSFRRPGWFSLNVKRRNQDLSFIGSTAPDILGSAKITSRK